MRCSWDANAFADTAGTRWATPHRAGFKDFMVRLNLALRTPILHFAHLRPGVSTNLWMEIEAVTLLRGGGEVALADLHLHALAVALDANVAKCAVELGVAGCVGGDVLGAQLVFNLLKGGLKLGSVIAYVDQPAARLLRQPLHGRIA